MLLSDDALESDARVYNEARTLLRNGYDVTVVVWNRKGASEGAKEYEGIKIERIPLKVPFLGVRRILFLYILFFNVKTFIRLLSLSFDVVHCHDLDTLVAGVLSGKLRHKKIVYDAHEIYPLMIQEYLPKSMVGLLSALEFSLIKKVDFMVTVSQILYDYFRVGVQQGNISIIMNFKDSDVFKIPERDVVNLRKRFGIENRFVILYDGWLIPGNGLEELFSAFVKLDGQMGDMVAVICGDGYAEEEYKRTVKEKHIEAYVKFAGRVDSGNIPVFVNACDVVYVVRRPEKKYNVLSTPNRLFEAIVAGKPVIASNFGNVKRIVETGGFGLLVKPTDVNELCSALLTLMNNREVRERLCKNVESMSRTFNWTSMEKSLLSIYERLILSPINRASEV